MNVLSIQLFKVVPEQNGKVEYERERMLGIANKFINFLAIPSSLSRSYSTFPLFSWTTFIEIAVCTLISTFITLSLVHIHQKKEIVPKIAAEIASKCKQALKARLHLQIVLRF